MSQVTDVGVVVFRVIRGIRFMWSVKRPCREVRVKPAAARFGDVRKMETSTVRLGKISRDGHISELYVKMVLKTSNHGNHRETIRDGHIICMSI